METNYSQETEDLIRRVRKSGVVMKFISSSVYNSTFNYQITAKKIRGVFSRVRFLVSNITQIQRKSKEPRVCVDLHIK